MFKKATKKNVSIKAAITGPSGSGKTFSALRLAKGLGGKLAVIDTENGSASLYSDKFDFDVLEIIPPFTVEKYIQAIESAEKSGYQTLIIDSLTHAWAGEGGLLEQKAQLDSRPGSNSYTNWAPITKKDNLLKNAYLHSQLNVITTMRSKQDYLLVENEKGKSAPKKVGLAPIQRDGLEYEFTVVFDVAMTHECETSKDRTGIFTDKIFKITEETGALINKWKTEGNISPSVDQLLITKEPISNKQGTGVEITSSVPSSQGSNLVDKVMAARPSVQQSPIIESLLNDPEPPEPPHFDAHEKVDEYENENNVYKVPEEKKEVFEPGDFVLPFKKGKNAGKKLKDISENDLKSTLIFCDEKGLANVATRIREYFNSKDEMPF